jgi:hypothetical protein
MEINNLHLDNYLDLKMSFIPLKKEILIRDFIEGEANINVICEFLFKEIFSINLVRKIIINIIEDIISDINNKDLTILFNAAKNNESNEELNSIAWKFFYLYNSEKERLFYENHMTSISFFENYNHKLYVYELITRLYFCTKNKSYVISYMIIMDIIYYIYDKNKIIKHLLNCD